MISKMLRLLLIFCILFSPAAVFSESKPALRKASFELPKNSEKFRFIRIFLQKDVKEISISTDSPYLIRDKHGRPIVQGPSMAKTQLRAAGGVIKWGTQTLKDGPVTFESIGHSFRVGSYVYRHIILVKAESNGTLMLINEIPLEDYLKGVLPWEINPKWPIEALKAQAIASRTFAFFKMLENQKADYDVRTDVFSQVYKGKNVEHRLTNQAIDQTQGQVLTHKGKMIVSYFHSTCGGATADIGTLWHIEDHPSLKGTKCTFCKTSPHYRWEGRESLAEIERKIKKSGHTIKNLKNLKPVDKDKSGRAEFIEVEDEKGKRKFRAADFRIWVGADKIKSTLFDTVSVKGGQVYFKGRGWGHGGGMCQYGMKKLGQLGYTYQQILKYYYPETDIKQYWTPVQPNILQTLWEKSVSLSQEILE